MVYLWVDANVVLRFLTGDPPEMAAKALQLMSRAEKGDIGLRVAHLVVAEIVWVLSSFYRYDKSQIAEALLSFLGADGIYAENPALLIQALQDMARTSLFARLGASETVIHSGGSSSNPSPTEEMSIYRM